MKTILNPVRIWPLMKCLLLLSLLAAVPARAMIFMWKDSAGIAHYSNKEYDVPARYKAKVKMMYPDASDVGTVQPGNAATPASQPVPPPVAVSQALKPAVQPETGIMTPAVPVKNIPTATPERRVRKQRERNRDDDE